MMTEKENVVEEADRLRFFDLMNSDNLSWDDFWDRWDDDDVTLMLSHGG